MKIVTRSALGVIFLLLAVAPGSLATTTPVEELAHQDVTRSSSIGRMAGTFAGALIGRKTGLGEGRGAAIGGTAGAIAGAKIGEVAAKRRIAYASESDFVEAEISQSKEAITAKRAEIQRLRSDLAATRSEISELQRRHRENQDVSKDAGSALQDVNDQIERNEVQLQRYKAAIGDINEVIASSQRQTESTTGLESKRNELIAKRSELRSIYQSMEGINDGYKEQRIKLRRLASAETSSRSDSEHTPGTSFPKIPSFNLPSGL